MYRRVLVAVDNSQFSDDCCAAAVSLARAFGSKIVGCHVYAAGLHDRRFRQMEAGLPEQYLEDTRLEHQRAVHASLISLGLQLISDCYLDSLARRCQQAEVPFARKTFDGKNWERLVDCITVSGCDLVVLGARGHGTARTDAPGSVCLRVLRRTRADALVIKELGAFGDGAGRSILVALDGSPESFGALEAALALAKAYRRPVHAVAAYDPYFHYAMFHSMVQVLSPDAARLFKFKEQERLHEEVIDSGLARLYQTYLDIAHRLASAEGVSLETHLLSGRAADELVSHAEKTRPWLLLLGRVGSHSGEDMDIGSVTEHVLRTAPCNLLVVSRRASPPLEVWGQSSLHWTEEAEGLLERVPSEHRAALRLLVQRLALERGHTVVTASLVREAGDVLRPRPEAARHMAEAAISTAVQALLQVPGIVYLCPRCGHAAQRQRPVLCPACKQEGKAFLEVDTSAVDHAAHAQGGVEETPAFDGRPVRWSRSALEALGRIERPGERGRTRLRIEKAARLAKVPAINLEFVLRFLPELPGQ